MLWNRSSLSKSLFHTAIYSTIQGKRQQSHCSFHLFQEHRETVVRQLWNITILTKSRVYSTGNYKHNAHCLLCPYSHVPHKNAVETVISRKDTTTVQTDFHMITWNLQQIEPEVIKDRVKSFTVFIKVWPRNPATSEQRVCRAASVGLCLCHQCIMAPSDAFGSQHHISCQAHLYPEATFPSHYMETVLQQYWRTFHRIMSSNTPFHRHSSLFAFIVYICSLTSIPGLNLTFCYWKHDTVQFVRVIIMWSSVTEGSQ